jgi:hypothetical protein
MHIQVWQMFSNPSSGMMKSVCEGKRMWNLKTVLVDSCYNNKYEH